MFSVNHRPVVREDDRSLFDPARFLIFNFNPRGYHLLNTLRQSSFSKDMFFDKCTTARIASTEAEAFWKKCVTQHVIVRSD